VVVGLATFGWLRVPSGSFQAAGRWAIAVVGLLVLLVWSLWPYLRWRTTQFVLTNRRVILRTGVLSRTGRDIPLHRVNDVTFSHSLFERILRCGTLVVESGGERGQLSLRDVPQVESVQREVYRLMEDDDARRRPRDERNESDPEREPA
jgi:uncharacterized membrane protein YdbT with pleckstrin-like domain